MTVYIKLSSNSNFSGEHHSVLDPRNFQQVKNHQLLTRDNNHLYGSYIQCIYALPEMIDTFVELIQSNADSPVCVVYDTAFNLGDCYVSPLVFRHVLFKNTPWIPLAFLVHDKKFRSLRVFVGQNSSSERKKKEKRIPFITDREPALMNAFERVFPNLQVLNCWNHLKRDFKEELRKLGADPSEIEIYLYYWRQMTKCENEDKFEKST